MHYKVRRAAAVDLPHSIAVPMQIFIVFLTIILWKRDAEASGS